MDHVGFEHRLVQDVRALLKILIIMITVAGVGAREPDSGVPASPPCENRLVQYSKPDPTLARRITFERSPRSLAGGGVPADAQKSPQGTRWFVLDAPDFTKPGPWSSSLTVYSNPRGSAILRVGFKDHASYGVRATWLNEKILFVQVWWGCIASTDLILDVERGKTIYGEQASMAAFLDPCDDGRDMK